MTCFPGRGFGKVGAGSQSDKGTLQLVCTAPRELQGALPHGKGQRLCTSRSGRPGGAHRSSPPGRGRPWLRRPPAGPPPGDSAGRPCGCPGTCSAGRRNTPRRRTGPEGCSGGRGTVSTGHRVALLQSPTLTGPRTRRGQLGLGQGQDSHPPPAGPLGQGMSPGRFPSILLPGRGHPRPPCCMARASLPRGPRSGHHFPAARQLCWPVYILAMVCAMVCARAQRCPQCQVISPKARRLRSGR